MPTDDCLICRKHRAEVAPPPGGYLWEDKSWLVCHAPADIAGAGTLILVAAIRAALASAYTEP
jgi:hypothetical protein